MDSYLCLHALFELLKLQETVLILCVIWLVSNYYVSDSRENVAVFCRAIALITVGYPATMISAYFIFFCLDRCETDVNEIFLVLQICNRSW